MGASFVYSLYCSVVLLAGYFIYKMLMASEKQPVFNRVAIIAIYAGALLSWPLSQLNLHSAPSLNPAVTFDLTVVSIAAEAQATPSVWPKTVAFIWLVGVVLFTIWTLIVAIRLTRIIRTARHVDTLHGSKVMLHDNANIAPFSWRNYVVLSSTDYEENASIILAHEQAHIRNAHWLDLLLAQIVCIFCWYCPAAWLLRGELRTVHEYQADAATLASGIDARQYQLLLIKKAVGSRFQALANSLNHSNLKKRITMMYKSKSSGWHRMRATALVMAPLAAIAVFNIPTVSAAVTELRSASFSQSETDEPLVATVSNVSEFVADKVTENSVSVQATIQAKESTAANKTVGKVENIQRVASFPGGETAMYQFLCSHIKYPEEALNVNRQGQVVVGFTVTANGDITDIKILKSQSPDLDQAAVDVIKSMPKWEPALDNGKPVQSQYATPVNFKLYEEPAADPAYKDTRSVMVVAYNDKGNPSFTLNDQTAYPPIYVNGKLSTKSINEIDPSTIESITVQKKNAQYPEGRIDISLK